MLAGTSYAVYSGHSSVSVTATTKSPVPCLRQTHVLLCLQGVMLCFAECRRMAWTTSGQ